MRMCNFCSTFAADFKKTNEQMKHLFFQIRKYSDTSHSLSKRACFIAALLLVFVSTATAETSSGFQKLDEWTRIWKEGQQTYFGYPVNQRSPLHEFYEWFLASGLDVVNLNNAGDPMTDEPWKMGSHAFERDVIEFFAPLYGFEKDSVWGIVTHSGTDGNNHGIYFGANYLQNKTGMRPVVYVSDEAHYSNMRLCDLQNLEVKLIKSDAMGRMIPEELEKALDTSRPVLMVYAMGSTFKGAIDDQNALNAVLDAHPEIPAVYRHVDAALFGGYLPFTAYKDLVSHRAMRFDAIAVSGHKFFGIDSPSGLFLCTRETYDNQNNFNVTYLNGNMRMINCSRDAIQPLKFWWLIRKVGYDNWSVQANQMLECTAYLKQQLQRIGWPCWSNEYSNTVFFRRPPAHIISKYTLAQGYDERFGGELAHVVVMQHVTKEKIDRFVAELENKQVIQAPEESSSAKADAELEEGDKYVSEDGTVTIVYNEDKKLMFLHTTKPLMQHTYLMPNSSRIRTIVHTVCHIGNEQQVLTFDLSNKVYGVAIMSSLYAFRNNVKLYKYFKKHKPDSFIIDIPYETQHATYQMTLTK